MDCKLIDFEKFLHYNERANNTINKYLSDVEECINVMGNDWNRGKLLEYKKMLCEKYHKVTTINSKISSINAFISFTIKNSLVAKSNESYRELQLKGRDNIGEYYTNNNDIIKVNANLNTRIRQLKVQKNSFATTARQLDKADVRCLINVARNKKHKEIYYIMQVLLRTGIRVSELKYITVEAVKNREALIYNKGKVRKIILMQKLCIMLRDFCREKKIKEGIIFKGRNNKPLTRQSVWRMLKSLCTEANVDSTKVFPHNFRHLFARIYYKETKDIKTLSIFLGHSSVNTTMIYLKETEEECRKKLERVEFVL